MKKTGAVQIRIDQSIKEEAERILKSMGLSPAMAIDIFYRQIIFQRKMPFEIKCPDFTRDGEAFPSTGESF
jgi:DNA-damage-inducible protein J